MTITVGGSAATIDQLRQIREQLGTPSSGGALSSFNGFDAQVASMKLVHDIRFGTAAAGGTLQVKALADLSANFMYHQQPNDAGYPYVTHHGYYEYRKFDHAQAGSTYVFGANDLTLQPTSDHDISATMVTQMEAGSTITQGTSEPMSKLGLSSTSGLWIGRVALFPYARQFPDSSFKQPGCCRVVAFDGSNVTLESLNPNYSGQLRCGNPGMIIWTTATACQVTASTAAGATVLGLSAAPPAQVQTGMMVNAVITDGVPARILMGGTHVLSVSGSTVNVSAPGMQHAVGANGYVVFVPRFWTGQLVTNALIPEPGIGEAYAMELDATWADNGSGVMPATQYMDTLPAYTAAGGDNIPMATWASFWTYEAHDPSQFPVEDDGGAEIDMMEVWGGVFHGPANLSCAYHALGLRMANLDWLEFAEGYPTRLRANGTWQPYGVLGGASGKSIVGVHHQKLVGTQSSTFKRQLVWERDRASIYMDGALVTTWRGQWASRRAARIVINASLGGFAYAPNNLNYPNSAAGLANSRVKVRQLRVWKL